MKKFIAISLTVIVLIAGVFCLNIGAEGDEPSVVISGHNLTLENNIYIVYYLQAKNIPEGAEYGLLVWTEAQDEYTYANADYRIAPVGTQTISGVIYDRFEYQNVAAKQMADNIYAMGYIDDGENITYSALDKYSVLQYAANKINTTTNAKLKALLKGMLDYGTAAQTYFGYHMDRLSNATYYTVTVEGGTLSDGTTSGLYQNGDSVTLIAPKTDANGLFFSHWEDSSKNKCSASTTYELTVGASDETYTAVYTDTYVDIWDGSIATGFAGGSGTEEDPYLISTGAQLAYLAYVTNYNIDYELFNNKHFKLTNSINLNGLEWDPIGGCHQSEQYVMYTSFQGVFDGDGFSISNFKISSSNITGEFGLFAQVHNAKIINTNVENIEIVVTCTEECENEWVCAGGIASYVENGYFENCSSSGKINITTSSSNQAYALVGGIVGSSSGESYYINCSSSCDIKAFSPNGFSCASGIVAIGSGTFDGCSSNGSIVSKAGGAVENSSNIYVGIYAAGILGVANEAEITRSYSNANINAESFGTSGAEAGGIIARAASNIYCYCEIENCFTTGNVSAISNKKFTYDGQGGLSYAGGIIGYADDQITAVNCYSTGNISAVSISAYAIAGGIAGDSAAQISNCFSAGNISGVSLDSAVGGIAGYKTVYQANNYRYKNQILSKDNAVITLSDHDICSISQLNSVSFYTDALGWSTSIWDFSDLDFENGKYPVFKEKSEYSLGLEYTLDNYGESYSVTGTGTCTDTDIVIPSTYEGKPVTEISSNAFSDNNNVKSLTIPASVTTIGKESFVFNNCNSLENFIVDEDNEYYKSIDGNLYTKYYDSFQLNLYAPGKTAETFIIPDTVTEITNYAFYGHDYITDVIIPDSVAEIGWSAFSSCKKLKSVTIGSGVTKIDLYAFNQCEELINITVSEKNTAYKSIDGNLYSKDGKFLIVYAIGKSDTSFTVPNEVTGIFDQAFRNCDAIRNVIITSKVSYVDGLAFMDCDSLSTITFESATTDIHDDANTISETATIYGFTGSLAEAYAIKYNRTFVSIGAFGSCEATDDYNVKWLFNATTGVLTISGHGVMANYDSPSSAPWYPYLSKIKTIVIEKGVTSIGDYAFTGYSELASVIANDSTLTRIGKEAFSGCTSLLTFEIPKSCTTIDTKCFANDVNLKLTVNSDSLNFIGSDAFSSVSSIEWIGDASSWSFSVPSGQAWIYPYLPDDIGQNHYKTVYNQTFTITISSNNGEKYFKQKQDYKTSVLYNDYWGYYTLTVCPGKYDLTKIS